MHLKEGYVLREIAGKYIVIGEGLTVDFSRIVSINSSAAYLWKSVQDREFDAGTLTELLLEEYEVERPEAEAAAAELAQAWLNAGLAEE